MSEPQKIVKAHCNRCGNETKHDVVMERIHHDSQLVDPYAGIAVHWQTTHTMLECRGCEEVSFRRVEWCSEADPFDPGDTTYFPPRVSRRRPAWFEKLPGEYSSLLSEIYSALHADSRSLAMMGLRTLIDVFMSRKLQDSLRFEEGLKQLVERNYITTRSLEVIKAAVEAGHAATHRAHKPTADQLEAVMDIVENLIQHDLLSESAESLRQSIPPRPPRATKSKTSDTQE